MAIKTIIKAMERLTNRRLAVGMAAEHIKSKVAPATKKENKR